MFYLLSRDSKQFENTLSLDSKRPKRAVLDSKQPNMRCPGQQTAKNALSWTANSL